MAQRWLECKGHGNVDRAMQHSVRSLFPLRKGEWETGVFMPAGMTVLSPSHADRGRHLRKEGGALGIRLITPPVWRGVPLFHLACEQHHG